MHLVDTLRSILRRWYIFLLGLVVSFGLAGAAAVVIQPSYEAEGTLLLMPPTGIVGPEGNPYLYLGGMTEALDVLVRRSNAPEAVEAVESQFNGLEISSAPDRTTSSPILIITVSGSSEPDALKAIELGRSVVIRELDSMQNELDVPQSMHINTEDLVIANQATANRKVAIQLAILIAAAGVVGTLMFTGFMDGQLLAREAARGDAGRSRQRGKQRADGDDASPSQAALDDAPMPGKESTDGQEEPAKEPAHRVPEGVQR